MFWVKLMQRGYTRSITGLYRVLKKTGEMAVKPKNPKYIPKPYEKMCFPGQRVQVDVKFVPAYKLSNKIDTQLAIDTVNLAVADRGKSKGIIFHTDRGCQFTAKRFRKHLDNLNMVQSFSAKGHPYDNAVMECFFKYLKKEEIDRNSYHSVQELNLSLIEYINGFYNSLRPHSHNNGLSPDQAEHYFFT